jgi:hypothetical protein
VRSSSGGIGTIYLDGRKCCGGTEDCGGRERGCWDELMDDGELFDDEEPWLSDDRENR